MMTFGKNMKKKKFPGSAAVDSFVAHHELLACASLLIGLPVFLIVTVYAATAAVALPMAWIFGWL